MGKIILCLVAFCLPLYSDSFIRDKKGFYFASDLKVKTYFTKRQALRVEKILQNPKILTVKHRYGKVKIVLNHYKVLSWKEQLDEEKDLELAKLFASRK